MRILIAIFGLLFACGHGFGGATGENRPGGRPAGTLARRSSAQFSVLGDLRLSPEGRSPGAAAKRGGGRGRARRRTGRQARAGRPAGRAAPDVSTETLCHTLASVAQANGLPTGFFARLIWQESKFDQRIVSRAGAQGVAQFMPEVAAERGLLNPFDALAALPHSGRFLKEHLQYFGNLGLAAAAYNAGARRVTDWLARRGRLPEETRQYVKIITGQEPERWTEKNEIDLRGRVAESRIHATASPTCRAMPNPPRSRSSSKRRSPRSSKPHAPPRQGPRPKPKSRRLAAASLKTKRGQAAGQGARRQGQNQGRGRKSRRQAEGQTTEQIGRQAAAQDRRSRHRQTQGKRSGPRPTGRDHRAAVTVAYSRAPRKNGVSGNKA